MAMKRIRHDGPQISCEGWKFDYRLLNRILELSALHKANREHVEAAASFLEKHPLIRQKYLELMDDTRSNLQSFHDLWRELQEDISDEKKRAEREAERQRAALRLR